ncbi:FAD-dependent monooxygenase [Saccharopolyspora sp. K220]|uniref:FAD-dependent monooxygenase n=1 Tax=Saccharopolyspora soli TaxID=2926618 RepID=UPI001F5ABAA1|nr:FAD-dependent monooxygenase [Saccharopolyspora soli]MCI2422231.1 FAD-dependent monooxygenase [Saccharopolyspora soli]
MGSPGLRVAIVGGGIGGMATANALVRHGIEVAVYEQAPELGEIGAGVLMTPNSVRLLERIGMGPALAAVGARIGDGSQYYRKDGTLVAPILTTDSQGWNGMYGMHRADLLTILADGLPNGVIHTNHQCVGFDQDEAAAHLQFDNGASATADVVIAADGIHSALQRYVVAPSRPVHSGSVAYRGLIPAERLPWWRRGVSQLWMGEGKHFLVYPVRSGELINYVGFVPSDERTTESWSAPGDPVALAAAFAGWDSPIERLLTQVDTTFWWGLYDREPLSTWTNGRLTLLGDAAHPMLPHVGQGANQAIEDAVALATLLATRDGNTAREALQAYESLRRPRVAEVQRGARANGQRYDSAYDDLNERDAEIAASVTFRSWLYDYDVEADAGELAGT